ncbi:hypothetical protein SAMN05421776_1287 [Nocardia farcinica]|uniref:Uncharacterized protein n=1 Tax=Nocardia farcinica TaxID=37329 RepID=A0A0H5P8E7_NOCFR|nr:hypothetical protein [Nocardia farcinica]AXK88486.1 hypothetical protein DXT66_25315 [Nocardia farcinica]PFW98324.1 hypothetical protein CJ469_06341 [Nocardia farcinica]PFX00242.1 hypothetical protein CJ468_06281 [Nocardia farcinica]CRY84080.1 Uncharacterised protein [Nocardia farcinica]SIT34591.1 hypothetical protein SAMN05421776_1287 [Nocardia farcinica]
MPSSKNRRRDGKNPRPDQAAGPRLQPAAGCEKCHAPGYPALARTDTAPLRLLEVATAASGDPAGSAHETDPAGGAPVAVMVADLVALALILTTFVAIVLCASPSAAVISALGAAIAVAFRAWRKRANAR